MKNRCIKHTHISENKFRQVLRLFCTNLHIDTNNEGDKNKPQSCQLYFATIASKDFKSYVRRVTF